MEPDQSMQPAESQPHLKSADNEKGTQLHPTELGGPYRYGVSHNHTRYSPQQKAGIRGIWNAVADNTTGHGYRNFNHSRGAVKKLYWTLAILSMTVVLLLGVRGIVARYFRHGVQVTVGVQRQQQQVFPAVTLCNMSPVRQSAMDAFTSSVSKKRKKRSTYCLSNWTGPYNGHCYYIADYASFTWSEAENDCISRGSHLASIGDANELAYINENRDTTQQHWFGLVKSIGSINSPTYWLDGSNYTYRNWETGAPDEVCVCIRINVCGCYNDKICSEPLGYVCKTTADIYQETTTASTTAAGVTTAVMASTEQTTTWELTTALETTTTTEQTTDATKEETTTAKQTTALIATTTSTTVVETTASKQSTSVRRPTTQRSTSLHVTTTAKTTKQTTPTSIRPTVVRRCCCRCCLTNAISTCNQCVRGSLADSASCAATFVPTSTQTAVKPFVTVPQSRFQSPPMAADSAVPDRPALTAVARQQQQLTETLAAMTTSQKSALGFSRRDLLVDCTYDDEACDIDQDFTQFYNPTFGNCYMFNSGWNSTSSPVKLSTRAGIRHGLSMIINIQQNDYTTQVGSTAGVVVLVLPQNIMPFPEDFGLLVRPGYATSISVTTETIERLSQPFDNCTDENGDRNLFSQYHPVQYSTLACMRTCYQRKVINTCNCSDPYYPVDIDNVKAPVCSSANSKQDDCLYVVSRNWANSSGDCDCPDRCSDTNYKTTTTSSFWPPNRSRKAVMQYLIDKIGPKFDVNDHAYVRKNLIRLDVFYSDFVLYDVDQSQDYPFDQLMIDFGGVIGLWLGFAFMTSMELFEFLVDLTVCTVHRLSTRTQ